MEQTIQVITLVGLPLTQSAIRMLEEFGQVEISVQKVVRVVPAPSPVSENEKFYVHMREAFWTTLFRKFVDEGYTLFHDERGEIWIRITKKFTYIFAKDGELGRFGKLETPAFLSEYNQVRGKILRTSIWSLLNSDDVLFEMLIDDQELSDALEFMNWDGNAPLISKLNEVGRSYMHKHGRFTPKKFLELVRQGVVLFSEKDSTYVRIYGDTTHIFVGGLIGIYATIDTSSFLLAFENSEGYTFRQRVGLILRNSKLNFNSLSDQIPRKLAFEQIGDSIIVYKGG